MKNTELDKNTQSDFEGAVNKLYEQSLTFGKKLKIHEGSESVIPQPPMNYLKADPQLNEINPQFVNDQYNKIFQDYFKNNVPFMKKIRANVLKTSLYTEDSSFTKSSPSLGPITTLQSLIEKTYFKDKKHLDLMLDQFCKLEEQDVYKFRSISGDGNCYFRSINAAYFEHLVLTRNEMALKQVIVDVNSLFTSENSIINSLSKDIASPYKAINKEEIIAMLFILLSLINKNPSSKDDTSRVKEAYEFLVKCFNSSKHFDLGLVLLLRYKIMLYIDKNKDNSFSSDIRLGNLLPLIYETEKGEFLFDKFFKDYLLKLFTFAENIVVYVTPFVLNCNIKVVVYDFGKNAFIEKNSLECGEKGRGTFYILHKKCHYDLIYSQEYFNQYSNYLSFYAEIPDEDKMVKTMLINNYKTDHPNPQPKEESKAAETIPIENINNDVFENSSLNAKQEDTSTISEKLSEKKYYCTVCSKEVGITKSKLSLCGNCLHCTNDCLYKHSMSTIENNSRYFI